MINIALFSWPIITLILSYRVFWPLAVIVSLFGGYLLLPENHGINLPLLPAFSKATIPCLTLFVVAFLARPGEANGGLPNAIPAHYVQKGWIPRHILGMVLVGAWLIGAVMTALTNGDRLFYGPRVVQGLSLYDGFAIIVAATAQLLPLLLGRKYFAHSDMHRFLLTSFVTIALLYSLLTLYEIRMSPQLNLMLYGFFPHDWHQHTRADGFRPIVFLGHGLKLSLFMAMGAIAAAGLARAGTGNWRLVALLAIPWLLGTVYLSKSLGALAIALILVPVAFFVPTRIRLLVAAGLAVVVLTYPMLRSVDLIPTDRALALAESVDPNRAASLNYRLRNEDNLLAKAAERPLFGWGGWGRNRVIDEQGRDNSVTDGSWVIAFGTGGWSEYLSKFGLLTLPIILLALGRGRMNVESVTAALCLVLTGNIIDLIPNSGQSPITWLIAGALLGRLELGRQAQIDLPDGADVAASGGSRHDSSEPRVSAYTRQAERHTRQVRTKPRNRKGKS
jgi:hypothetical protein